MRRHHDRRTSFQSQFNTRHRGTNAGVFGDAARIVLRNIQVGTNKYPLGGDLALGDEVLESENVHG